MNERGGRPVGDSKSIINLGELAKPANTLIDKISDAIGGIAKPWQIKRVAEAEAEALRIREVAQIEVTKLQQRAMRRFLMEEAKKQNNIEAIISKALPEVTEQSKPEHVEDDWITNFFDKCRLISDEEMQKLWAKILAGEANSPGRFSKRTVGLLGSLDKYDAVLFAHLCSFNFDLGGPYPLIYDIDHKIYTDREIVFGALSHLESIGLIQFNHLTSYVRRGLNSKGFVLYFGTPIYVEFPQPSNCEMQLGHVILTQSGRQLASICGGKPRDGFVEYAREKWKSFGYKTEPQPEKPTTQESACGPVQS
jgi:uncharacterized protein DUF2806